jgi:hypothetical protein
MPSHPQFFQEYRRLVSRAAKVQLFIAVLFDKDQRAASLKRLDGPLQHWELIAFDIDFHEGHVGQTVTVDSPCGDRTDAQRVGQCRRSADVRKLSVLRIVRKIDLAGSRSCCDVQRRDVRYLPGVAFEEGKCRRNRFKCHHVAEDTAEVNRDRADMRADVERDSELPGESSALGHFLNVEIGQSLELGIALENLFVGFRDPKPETLNRFPGRRLKAGSATWPASLDSIPQTEIANY